MTAIVFYFQVHQPYRLRRYTSFDIGEKHDYFDDRVNREIVERVAERCYVPMNEILRAAIEETEGAFRCSFSLSGTVMRQLEEWVPEALDSFVTLAETGNVEFICETSCHSLAALGDPAEFEAQVALQRERIEAIFGTAPVTFRNTELVIDETIAKRVEDMGFEVLLGEGADPLLHERSARRIYRPRGCRSLKLLLRDYEFSDDIAFRFSNKEWDKYPLMADTYASWLHRATEEDRFIGLFMDYETFGEHQWVDTGIFDFMEYLPRYVLEDERFSFETPARIAAKSEVEEELRIPRPVSWADANRDLGAWLGNHMQRSAHETLYGLLPDVRRAAAAGHEDLLEDWRLLSTSDHVYYMCTRFGESSDGDVHEYFTPYESPHDSFILFMNVLDDLSRRVARALAASDTEAPSRAES